MSLNQQQNEVAVDRREETVVTQQPGYAATEQMTERRLVFYQVTRVMWTILGLIEILLGLRFLLKLIAANAESGFGALIYGISGVFIAPFAGLVSTPASGTNVLEVNTLIAMVIYALFFWVIVRVTRIVADRPISRTATRSVHEQMPNGSNRTTNTTKIG